MSEVTIRYGTSEDAGLLAALGSRAFTQAFGSQNTPENLAHYLAESFSNTKQTEELTRPGSLFLIAEIEGEAVGFARLQAGSTEEGITAVKPIELVRIYVLTEWIGKGVGARLMETCIQEAKSRNHDVLWLGVWQKNASAINFYYRWGFREVGTHTFQLGDDTQIDWVMILHLID